MTHTKDEALKLAKECGATTYTNRHYPEATAVTFSPVAWEKFCEQALAQPTNKDSLTVQPAPVHSVELADEQIEAALAAWFNWAAGGVEFHIIRMRRAIEAALSTPPAQRKPLTKEQIESGRSAPWGFNLDAFTAGARFAEAAHGIKEKNT